MPMKLTAGATAWRRISDENVSHLLAGVADLISERADRRMRRKLRRAS